MEFVDLDGDGLPDIQTESDLDALLATIALWKEIADPHNVFQSRGINEYEEYSQRWFDEDGNRLPVLPDPDPQGDNISPAEVHLAPGAEPTWRWSQGVRHSEERYNGCTILAGPYIMGNLWIEQAPAQAARYGVSERSIAMAGYRLVTASKWVMPPISRMPVADARFETDEVYWFEFEVPVTDEEVELFVSNYGPAAMHGSILAGASFARAPLFTDPRTREGRIAGCDILTSGQLPQMIPFHMRQRYQTARMLREAWHNAINEAHMIDHAPDGVPTMGPTPGYKAPDEHSQAWYEQYENGDKLKTPRFILEV